MSENKPGVLIVGADSLIGSALFQACRRSRVLVRGTTRRPDAAKGDLFALDLGDRAQIEAFLPTVPDSETVVICAGVTSVDRCQSDPEGTSRVNIDGVEQLCEGLIEKKAHIIFLSTNQVFDGAIPYTPPEATLIPLTEYGRQKAEIEGFLSSIKQGLPSPSKASNPKRKIASRSKKGQSTDSAAAKTPPPGNEAATWTIVRLSKVWGERPTLIERWAQDLAAGKPIHAFHDMFLSPVPLSFVTVALSCVLAKRNTGIFQISGSTEISYFFVASRLAARMGVPSQLVKRVSMADSGITLYKPNMHCSLNTERLQRELGLTAPSVADTIDHAIDSVCSHLLRA